MQLRFDFDLTTNANLRDLAEKALASAQDVAADDTLPADLRIHRVRKACKQLRALLRCYRSNLGSFNQENAAVRDAAALLSGSRDAEVMRATFAHLPNSVLTAITPAAHKAARDLLETPRPGLADPEILFEQFAVALGQIRDRIPDWSLRYDNWSRIARNLKKQHARAEDRLGRAGSTLAAIDLHEARKELKYLGNQLSFLGGVADIAGGKYKRRLKAVANRLGEVNDLHVLRRTLAESGVATSGIFDRLLEEIDRRTEKLAQKHLKEAAGLTSKLAGKLDVPFPQALKAA